MVCPLGALVFYLHWLYDQYHLLEHVEIDLTRNASWRAVSAAWYLVYFVVDNDLRKVRLLFGKDPNVAYSDTSLYNLYVGAFDKAGFDSRCKAHFPRRMMGYRQVRMG